MEADVKRALELLQSKGIAAQLSHAQPMEIVGGKAVTKMAGITVYERGFSLAPSSDGAGWLVRLQGDGQLVEEIAVETLDAAVDAVAESLSDPPGTS